MNHLEFIRLVRATKTLSALQQAAEFFIKLQLCPAGAKAEVEAAIREKFLALVAEAEEKLELTIADIHVSGEKKL